MLHSNQIEEMPSRSEGIEPMSHEEAKRMSTPDLEAAVEAADKACREHPEDAGARHDRWVLRNVQSDRILNG